MKHFPSGDTLSKYQSQKVRKPWTTKWRRSQVYKTNDNKTKAYFKNPAYNKIVPLNRHNFTGRQSIELVTIVTVIDVVIGGFSGEDIKWLFHVTPITANCPITLSDYNFVY